MHRIRDLELRSQEVPVIGADVVRQQLADLQVTLLLLISVILLVDEAVISVEIIAALLGYLMG